VHVLLREMRNNEMKRRLLIDALKLELSTKRVRRMVIEWGLDVRGFDIFPVVKKVGDGKWNMQTLLSLAPLVAQLVAFGARCDIYHLCSSLIIRACRLGIIANLLWRYQTSCNICLPKPVIVNILQFVSSPQVMHVGKSWSASKMREGDNMMQNVIQMLGDTSETIYEVGKDCTPYPSGDISQGNDLENRDEYGSNSEFIPAEEMKESTKKNYPTLHQDDWKKRKWSKETKKTSEVYESKKDISSSVKPRTSNNLTYRIGHRQRSELNFFENDHDKENIYDEGRICSIRKERNHSIDHHAQWKTTRSTYKSRRSFGCQERNVDWSYNPSALSRRSDLEVDVELKMKWVQKRSKSSTNGRTPLWINKWNSEYQRSPNAAVQNLQMWTPEKFERLQERICLREKMKDLFANPSKQKPNKEKVNNNCRTNQRRNY